MSGVLGDVDLSRPCPFIRSRPSSVASHYRLLSSIEFRSTVQNGPAVSRCQDVGRYEYGYASVCCFIPYPESQGPGALNILIPLAPSHPHLTLPRRAAEPNAFGLQVA